MKITMMKKAVLAILLAFAPMLAFAQQNTLTQTTLSTAITSSQTVFNVASATGITAPTGAPGTATSIYIQDTGLTGELVEVLAVNGTTLTVRRGANGTAGQAHVSGAMVLAGRPNWFYISDPGGACTAANTLVTPYVNVRDGDQFLCSTKTGVLSWVPGFTSSNQNNAGLTADVASAAGAILPSGPLFHVTGTAAITGFTVPVGCNATASGSCSFTIIPDGVFTYTAAGNIAPASTGLNAGTAVVVVNQPITFIWDSSTSKFNPNTQ
ncbi:MAG: hypothetical protein ACREDQ_12670 [Limisphaerales bacterium]